MKKRVWISYFILAFLCFGLLNFKLQRLEKIRGPFFGFEELFAAASKDAKGLELAELKSENMHLKSQLDEVKGYLLSEDHVESIFQKCIKYENDYDLEFSAYYKRRLDGVAELLSHAKWQVTANVIYREPSNWSSAIWVDAGETHNKMYKKKIIAVDSPVIFGDHLVGVVEKVDKYKSLVRLITDSRVTPSVRCVRGYEQDAYIKNHMMRLKEVLSLQDGKYAPLENALALQIDNFNGEEQTDFLGKGYVSGSSHPIWRGRSLCLQGTGFNYNFGDDEGAPQSLHENSKIPLFQKGDVLLTTGMDGVFPANLLVAFVTKVFPMKEGAVSCDLQAKISLPEFIDLRKVTILPPLPK